MQRGRTAGRCGTMFLVAALAACHPPPAMTLSSQFDSARTSWSAGKSPAAGRPACRVFVAAIRDIRPNPESFGSVGIESVHSASSTDWLNSAFRSLSGDPRVQIVDNEEDSDVSLKIDLVKAYVETITSDKSSTVVLRIRYGGHSSPSDERTYRGVDTAVDWFGSREEIEGSLNDAMTKALEAVHQDILARCNSPSNALAVSPTHP